MKSGGLLGVLGAIGAGLFFFLPKAKKVAENAIEFAVPGVFEGEVSSPQDAVTVAVASGDIAVMQQTSDAIRANGYEAQADVLDAYIEGLSQ